MGFLGLNTALLGLMAQQRALEVISHNIANANTEGYTRQEAVMGTTIPLTVALSGRGGLGQLGTGVQISEIRQIRDRFVDSQIRDQVASQGNWETLRDYYEQVEAVLNEPSDQGINNLLGKFWGAWHDLSGDASNYAAKATVVENAGVLADALRRDASQLAGLRTGASEQIDIKVGEINVWLKNLGDLNKKILEVEVVGGDPNDLKDQRGLLLDKLARVVPISVAETQLSGAPTGVTEMVISLNDNGTLRTLVDGADSLLDDEDSRYQLDWSGGQLLWIDRDQDGDGAVDSPVGAGTATDVQDGELAGLQLMYNSMLNPADGVNKSLAWRLNELAEGIIEVVNGFHPNFFTGTGATDIEVNPTLVDNPQDVQSGDPAIPGDGSIALSIAEAQDDVLASLENSSIGDWYKALISKLGIDSKQSQTMASNQKLLVDHLTRNREAASGVSLDEEASNLIRFERAYQASARVMTVMDEMLDKIINGMGLVGR